MNLSDSRIGLKFKIPNNAANSNTNTGGVVSRREAKEVGFDEVYASKGSLDMSGPMIDHAIAEGFKSIDNGDTANQTRSMHTNDFTV